MSVNIKSQKWETTANTKYPNINSIHSIQIRYFEQDISNKRYSNSSNKNNIYGRRRK